MITANLATYPPRYETLIKVLEAISSQVDCINLVLNGYDSIPERVTSFNNVNAIIPDHDTKDAGKFYFDVSNADYVLLIDDDILYPDDYVLKSIETLNAYDEKNILAGYHCSIYQKPSRPKDIRSLKRYVRFYLKSDVITEYRKSFHYTSEVDEPILVDQIATGTAIIRGKNMPSYDYMKSSQKFVDVRLARWCFERNILRVCLPRRKNWLKSPKELGIDYEETIFKNFTSSNPSHVANEISGFAYKTPGVGMIYKY